MNSANTVEEVPFNPKNVLIDQGSLQKLLNEYNQDAEVKDINVYRKAFVHKSYCIRKNENVVSGNVLKPPDCLPLQEESNERLEFLGDSILNFSIARYLFLRYPNEQEGFLTKVRTKLVNGIQLGNFAGYLGIGKYLLISKQIEESAGRQNVKLLEDVFEAFLGAMLMDTGDYTTVETWVINFIETNVDFADLISSNTNYKDVLIKDYQHNYNFTLKFQEMSIETTGVGKKYTVCVRGHDGAVLGTGTGTSKKLAENDAAQSILAGKMAFNGN